MNTADAPATGSVGRRRNDRHFERGGSGARNGEQRADREHDGHAQHQSETFGHPGAQIAESARLRHDDHAEDRQSHCGDDETDHAHECAIAGESPEIGGKMRLPAPKNIEKNVMPTMMRWRVSSRLCE